MPMREGMSLQKLTIHATVSNQVSAQEGGHQQATE